MKTAKANKINSITLKLVKPIELLILTNSVTVTLMMNEFEVKFLEDF